MATTMPDQYPTSRPTAASTTWLSRALTLNWETTLYLIILILAIVTRFTVLEDRVMSHDESLHTYYSWRLSTAGNFQHTPLMHGPVLFHFTALSYSLFGANDFTSRIYTSSLGVLMVMMPFFFRRWLGKWGAILVALMLLASPLLMYYNRYIRHDTPSIVSAMIMAYATLMYLNGPPQLRRKARWLYLLALGMIWNLGSKETAFIYIAIFGLFFTIYWLARLYQHFSRRPSRGLFDTLIISIAIGGVAALFMFAVFSIGLFNYPTLEGRVEYLTTQVSQLFTGGEVSADFSIFATWTLLVAAGSLAAVIGTAIYATRRGHGRLLPRDILALAVLALVACLGLIVVEELTQIPTRASTAVVAPGDEAVAVTGTISNAPILASWVLAVVVVVAMVVSRRLGWWRTLHRFAELDVLIVMGSLIFPWLAPLVITIAGANPTDYSQAGVIRSLAVVIPFFIIALSVGIAWNWKRILIAHIVFYVPFVFFFTTMFTNPQGLASGLVGSLGYWLEQQGVKRGSQPQYYYQMIVMPLYEYLPLIGSFLASLAGLVIFWRRRSQAAERRGQEIAALTAAAPDPDHVDTRPPARTIRPIHHPEWMKRPPFLLFLSWWGVLNFIAYTMAGEKMPWLGTHLTVPLIFLSGWYFAAVFSKVEWSLVWQRGWLYLLLMPVMAIAAAQVVLPFFTSASPLVGLAQNDLIRVAGWLGALAVVGAGAYAVILIARSTGWRIVRLSVGVVTFGILLTLTARHAHMASFINYDLANEKLVYAHAAPGIKQMMDQLEDLSRRTTDGMNLRFVWGGNAWPVSWYFRDMTNATFFGNNPSPGVIGDAVAVYASDDIRSRVEPFLEDRYYRFTYIRMWWPDQDYFNLSGQRVTNVFDFNPDNTGSALLRQGLFDIWWSRDYTTYGRAVNRDYSLQNWPVSERLNFYVRKDIAAQVWNLGVGEGTVFNPLTTLEQNACTANWQQVGGVSAFNAPFGRLTGALGVAVDNANDRVYVAEEFANRITVFDRAGAFITILGDDEPELTLNRPNGVAVAPDGTLYIADTWNFRVVHIDPATGAVLRQWGQRGEFGAQAQPDPVDAFWGPRDIYVDEGGSVYVSDTGNKRIRVYTPEGQYLRDIGGAGVEVGRLEEPAGIDVAADGRVFVADTWNRRISVFDPAGIGLAGHRVRGWYEDRGKRPYLAVDHARGLLYVTDPNAGRVLVYSIDGDCLGSFGQPSDQPSALNEFNTIGGIAIDAEGFVYISDSEAGRVLKFAPFEPRIEG